jgi:hypothetical protein
VIHVRQPASLLIKYVVLSGALLFFDNGRFLFSPQVSNKSTACPRNNIGMVSALENRQMSLQVFFSDEFAECFKDFIDKLH